MLSNKVFLNASEHLFLLSSSESLMLRNYSRFQKFKYCSQIGGSESIRDIQEAKNIDAEAFEFQIVESLFSITKIIQSLEKIYFDDLELLESKSIFINISNQENINLINDLKNYKFPDFLKKTLIIINYDRRELTKNFFNLKNNDFEVSQYEEEINKYIFDSIKKYNDDKFLISISGGITFQSLESLLKEERKIDFIKTGLFSINTNNKDKLKLQKSLHNFQLLEAKLIGIMNNSIRNKTNYLNKRKVHLNNYLADLIN